MNTFSWLQKMLGVTSASACCSVLIALISCVVTYADGTANLFGSVGSLAGLVATIGAAMSCVLGAMIGLVVVWSRADMWAGALIGGLMIMPAAMWLYVMGGEMGYKRLSHKFAGLLVMPSGALSGLIAARAPSWAGGASPRQTVILLLLTGAPLMLLAAASGVKVAKAYIFRLNYRKHQEVVAKLDRANVQVTAKDAKVISDDSQHVLAEVTLGIRNIPPSISCYELNIHEVGQKDDYFTAAVRQTNWSIPNPYLKVIKTGQGWVFKDFHTGRVVSEDAENVTLRFDFKRTRAVPNELPDTLWPRLGIWDRPDNNYTGTYLFFYKPIPVSFKRDSNHTQEWR